MNDALTQSVERLARLARDEDLGGGDATTALMADPEQRAAFALLAKEPCVMAGRSISPVILAVYDPSLELRWAEGIDDGVYVTGGPEGSSEHTHSVETKPLAIATVTGSLRSILAVERVWLNFLQRLCGIATLTRRFVEAVAGSQAVICDTRKTTPGWRQLEKYAVRCGGGTNHRMGLYDGVLIKDNHLQGIPADRMAAAVFDMLNRLSGSPDRAVADAPLVEVEADSLKQVEALLTVVGIDALLLDNFTVDGLREAVALRDGLGLKGKVLLEASGGVTLERVRAVAESGVDRISVGALTHSATAVDLSLERTA